MNNEDMSEIQDDDGSSINHNGMQENNNLRKEQ